MQPVTFFGPEYQGLDGRPLEFREPVPGSFSKQDALEAVEQVDLEPESREMLAKEPSTSGFLKQLIQNDQFIDAVALLAYALTDEKAVRWAAEAAKAVNDFLPPEEVSATASAVAASDGSITREELEQTLSETHFQGPGAWAAQAALWALQARDKSDEQRVAELIPKAVEGAVRLAAALQAESYTIPEVPVPELTMPDIPQYSIEQPELIPEVDEQMLADVVPPQVDVETDPEAVNRALAPFLDMGMQIAAV
ncbi:MAG: hypothetical protein GY703_15875 [Gammaproteobacteria bacterium]|nr:hypothetical protein [Gammaproteobacteria bacterium]